MAVGACCILGLQPRSACDSLCRDGLTKPALNLPLVIRVHSYTLGHEVLLTQGPVENVHANSVLHFN